MRLEQAPVLVEPDGAMRTAELLGEVADGEVALVSFCAAPLDTVALSVSMEEIIVDVYVKVK